MSWSYWIFCTVITVLVGFIAVATAINLHCSFAFELLIIAVFICIPFRSIPIVKDEKRLISHMYWIFLTKKVTM